MGKRLLSAKEAGEYLGISHRTVWSCAQQGIIGSVRLRRRVLFDRLELDRIIDACKEGTEADT
jgi:excisionase family DNA binding protein